MKVVITEIKGSVVSSETVVPTKKVKAGDSLSPEQVASAIRKAQGNKKSNEAG